MLGRKMEAVWDENVYGEGGPAAKHPGDAGIDLRSSESFTLEPHSTRFCDLACRLHLPTGTYGALRPRSGLARDHGIDVIEGTVDENFTGPVGVTMRNSSDEPFEVERGMRVCQLVVMPYAPVTVVRVDDLPDDPRRGLAGYGSTGLA